MTGESSKPAALEEPLFGAVAPPALSPQRSAISAATRRPEPQCVAALLDLATLGEREKRKARDLAMRLVAALRAKGQSGPVAAMLQEYALSSQEGVALMCLAEALLRIPDTATRDALIRDKIALGDWMAHVHHSPSLVVNAATWGLVVTGKLNETASDAGVAATMRRLLARLGEPVIRASVDLAMRLMGQQFVLGQSIEEALAASAPMQARGFRYSYDMLGEAAMTAADAERYLAAYETAIDAIGQAAGGAGIVAGPGISIKLSALSPRYARAQHARVMAELLPRVAGLAARARRYDIGLNIDAEETDRLEISLDLLEALCRDPALAGWDGLGFVVQAYQKRCPLVIDCLVDLARRSGRRLMVRLVKGAYWDSEIKRAQVDGLDDYPVFTRKVHTDVSYIACARKLLAARDAVYPQFATHNAQTLASVLALAGDAFAPGDYELQCLHGMGEALYGEVVGPDKLARPCRIYAPVGSHETLLAYLVRRLLENGANTSFVNRMADPSVAADSLVEDPVDVARRIAPLGAPHPQIRLPRDMLGPRRNSRGLDLAGDAALADLAAKLVSARGLAPPATAAGAAGAEIEVRNPADRRDLVGRVRHATPDAIEAAFAAAGAARGAWAAMPAPERARCLERAADAMEDSRERLMGLIVREAGKTLPNALADVREAVDFLRYYAAEARATLGNAAHRPLGIVACISPWNFPIAIFTGQVAAALAAGNAVLAKPAEETPLTAAAAVALLHEAGVPQGALHLVPGAGEVGAALVADPRTCGVMFTGSTEVARAIQRQLARRANADATPVPLIAETGGLNAMLVDSSALPEQVVGDVIQSAFDSAGQRCSALRVLCLQQDIAEHVLAMLKGALAELRVGRPDRLDTDVGPVITAEAKAAIEAHIAQMKAQGHAVARLPLPEACAHGTFVAPTIIEIARFDDVAREVFGPVLHVLRFRPEHIDALVADINASGYGLTFGLHTRIDETVERVAKRISAGNVYVNRNIIGAVVGVQPFGGHGLSGTGPKAGGPLYLRRLLADAPPDTRLSGALPATARLWLEHVATHDQDAARRLEAMAATSPAGAAMELPGPVGERNVYTIGPEGRGSVLVVARSEAALRQQITLALATGNRVRIAAPLATAPPYAALLSRLPVPLSAAIAVRGPDEPVGAVLFDGDQGELVALQQAIAAQPGPIVPVLAASASGRYPLECLVLETSTSINTAAAGGNASLMSIG
ncbi:MAG: trifunctional transcriptional regulator/proline dehydrogenase/L-glutamate gamma-semialdehyde dehydrogenase [Hyphomicrobiaceae bacterium]|nr:trifunctional transcriptional regulator/proline dehydrogenase/L-glutamate gamma-semialdehyde dehydrogenase [Hyphomicrobiaceae bacterium]